MVNCTPGDPACTEVGEMLVIARSLAIVKVTPPETLASGLVTVTVAAPTVVEKIRRDSRRQRSGAAESRRELRRVKVYDGAGNKTRPIGRQYLVRRSLGDARGRNIGDSWLRRTCGFRSQSIVRCIDMIAGVIAIVIPGIRSHINVNATYVRGRRRPSYGDRVRLVRTAVLYELYRRIGRTTLASFKTGVLAKNELLRASGKIAGLSRGKIAVEPGGHLKSPNLGCGIRDDDGQHLLDPRSV